MSALQRALDGNGLTVAVSPADANLAMPNQDPSMTHWTVTFEGGATPVSFPVSIVREGGDESPPTPNEAVVLLQADLRHAALEGSPEEWLTANGIELDGPESEAWLRARLAALDLLEDARGLPHELQVLLLPAADAPSPRL